MVEVDLLEDQEARYSFIQIVFGSILRTYFVCFCYRTEDLEILIEDLVATTLASKETSFKVVIIGVWVIILNNVITTTNSSLIHSKGVTSGIHHPGNKTICKGSSIKEEILGVDLGTRTTHLQVEFGTMDRCVIKIFLKTYADFKSTLNQTLLLG